MKVNFILKMYNLFEHHFLYKCAKNMSLLVPLNEIKEPSVQKKDKNMSLYF